METSAKNATNVEQAFMAMAASIKNRFGNFHLKLHHQSCSFALLLYGNLISYAFVEWQANRHQTMHDLQLCRSEDNLSTKRAVAAHLERTKLDDDSDVACQISFLMA